MNDLIREEVAEALSESSFSYWTIDGRVRPAITEDWDLVRAVKNIEQAVQDIAIASSKVCWTERDSRGRLRIKNSKLGKRIAGFMAQDLVEFGEIPYMRMHPYVGLFLSAASDRGVIGWPPENTLSEKEKGEYAEAINGLVADIQQRLADPAFKKEIANHCRSANKNYASLKKLIDELRSTYARLMVIRLDLAYSANEGPEITFEEADEHRRRLFRAKRRTKMFEHLVGYAWKLEYGPAKRFHYHVLLFFNGAQVREDISIARIVGDYWHEYATEGKGIYYNCNAYKRKYKRCGIGEVNYYDGAAYEGLLIAAAYMVKTDYFVRAQLPDGRRIYGRSVSPREASGRGRPRKIQNRS